MTAQFLPNTLEKFFDNNGNPLAGGLLYTYQAGTTFAAVTWTDSTQATANTNPIVLNFRGECSVWLDPSLSYKFLLTDSLGNSIPGYPVDNIQTGFFLQTGQFTITGTGFSGVAPTALVTYIYIPGYFATITIPILSGTSNVTAFTATGLPAFLRPATVSSQEFKIPATDNSAEEPNATMIISAASGTLQFLKAGSLTGWTASASKGMDGTYTYLLL